MWTWTGTQTIMEASGRSESHRLTSGNQTWCFTTSKDSLRNTHTRTHARVPAQPSPLRSSAALMATSPSSTRLRCCWSTQGRSSGTLRPSSRATARSVSSISPLTCKTAAWNWEPGPTMDCWLSSTRWVWSGVLKIKKRMTSDWF